MDIYLLFFVVTWFKEKRSLSMTFLKESLEDKDEIKEEEDEDKLSHSVSIITHTEKVIKSTQHINTHTHTHIMIIPSLFSMFFILPKNA